MEIVADRYDDFISLALWCPKCDYTRNRAIVAHWRPRERERAVIWFRCVGCSDAEAEERADEVMSR